MRTIFAIAAVLVVMWASPAAAGQKLDHQTSYNAKPKRVAAVTLAARRVEMMAVTRRARADTHIRRAYLHDSQNMSKVMPGYPQPAFVSVDLRVKF